ncbi:hypothetical protein CHS0354_024374 [Potamilus streckersoni]|uniref:Schlafen AlbA-2 domain-containing protein n=1 Tax=Potamilus streckersoni TaxID=2493646 RepID=A0AAE0SFK1_9BIVA|nr:hypothetical protein CHS0354_024374 [Potamilus streckersoni]
MAHNKHAAVYMSNLRSDMRFGDLKKYIVSLFSTTLSVKINKSSINIITSAGNYSAIIDVRDENDIEHVLQHLSTFESRKKLAFNFMNIVPSGQMLDIKRFKLADEEQAKERLPNIYERQITEHGSNLSKFYVIGEKLGNETRNTEFKKAGGRYMETEMRKDVPNYLCGFLNSNVRGTLMFGVLDDGTVVGVVCSQHQEDRYRLDIDCAIKEIEPKLFPQHYKVEFVQVVDETMTLRANCKVIEVTVEVPSDQFKLYKTKDGVFMRRDGSLQVINAWSDLQELTHLKHRDGVNQLQTEFRVQLEQKERTIETQAETIQHQQQDLQQYRVMQQNKSKVCVIS